MISLVNSFEFFGDNVLMKIIFLNQFKYSISKVYLEFFSS